MFVYLVNGYWTETAALYDLAAMRLRPALGNFGNTECSLLLARVWGISICQISARERFSEYHNIDWVFWMFGSSGSIDVSLLLALRRRQRNDRLLVARVFKRRGELPYILFRATLRDVAYGLHYTCVSAG